MDKSFQNSKIHHTANLGDEENVLVQNLIMLVDMHVYTVFRRWSAHGQLIGIFKSLGVGCWTIIKYRGQKKRDFPKFGGGQ